MNIDQFTQELTRDGFEVATRSMEPNLVNSTHAHPFEVRALMLSGELTLRSEGKTQVCRTGDVFTMQAGCAHDEHFGPEGATYLAGRRQPAKSATAQGTA